MAKERQSPGSGLSDQQQAALVHLGKMMGPQSDEFDNEVQRLHDQRHADEHNATNYEQEFAEIPHEASYRKMKAAQRGGLGPSEMEEAAAKQQSAIQQTTGTTGQVQATKAQAAQVGPAPPPAPGGPEGVSEPYPAERGQTPPGIPEQ